jgi:glycosyltransferase involved in cell wall biosynthesis
MQDQFHPTITIITVVKDNLEGLRATAASISRQKSNNFEWLVVDGFSIDGTFEFAETLLVNSHFSLIRARPLGIYNAMNLGLNIAKGDWIWHLNAGDVFLENNLIHEIQKTAAEHSGLSVIATSVVYLSHLGYAFSISSPKFVPKPSWNEARFHHQGVILHRATAIDCGGYDEKLALASDGRLLDEMIRRSNYVILPLLTVGFEMGGASSQNFRKTLEEISSYRDYSHRFGPKLHLIIKNGLREIVLGFEKSSFLRFLVVPYLIQRQFRIFKTKPEFFIQSMRTSRIRPFLGQKTKRVITVEVLSASDLNNKYLGCVRHYIQSWNSYPIKNGIKYVPKVLLVAEKLPAFLEDVSQYLQLINPRELPTSFVSQASRLTETKNSLADYVMTSDIDMLPLSLRFENKLLSQTEEGFEGFFILRDVLAPGQYPICYNIAKPKTWETLLANAFTQVESIEILRSFLNSNGGLDQYDGVHGGIGWTLDQEMLWKMIEGRRDSIEIIKFTDLETQHRRLDRVRHRQFLKWLFSPLVLFGYFHDYHIHHPVQNNQKYLRLVIMFRNFRLRMYRV